MEAAMRIAISASDRNSDRPNLPWIATGIFEPCPVPAKSWQRPRITRFEHDS